LYLRKAINCKRGNELLILKVLPLLQIIAPPLKTKSPPENLSPPKEKRISKQKGEKKAKRKPPEAVNIVQIVQLFDTTFHIPT